MEGLAAIGGLVALAAVFAFFGMQAAKKAEKVRTQVKQDQIDAGERESDAIDAHHSAGDFAADDSVPPS